MDIQIRPLNNDGKNETTLDLLMKRRSVVAKNLGQPGPNKEEIETILTAGARVPDHGKTCPFYFIVFEGNARKEASKAISDIYKSEHPDADQHELEREEGRLSRAPLVIAVIHRHRKGKHPRWEQMLTVGAACQNMLVAAKALNYDGQWLTEWYAYSRAFRDYLGLDQRDEIAGFLHFGRAVEQPKERERPDLKNITNHWPLEEDGLKRGDEYDNKKFDLPDLGISHSQTE